MRAWFGWWWLIVGLLVDAFCLVAVGRVFWSRLKRVAAGGGGSLTGGRGVARVGWSRRGDCGRCVAKCVRLLWR